MIERDAFDVLDERDADQAEALRQALAFWEAPASVLPISLPNAPVLRRRRGPRIETVIKAAVKHGATVKIDDITIEPGSAAETAGPMALDQWLAKRGNRAH